MFGDVVDYKCDDGFNLVGHDDLSCEADGQWSNDAPVCQPVPCPLQDLDHAQYRLALIVCKF